MILDPEHSRAVLIGASTYAVGGQHARPAVATGAQAIADLFMDPSIWGLPAEHCQVLVGTDATEKRIKEALRAAAEKASAGLVVYYAGHGKRDRQKLFLAAHDSPARVRDWLPYEYVKDWFQDTPASRRILILDCCYSGHAAEYGPLGPEDDGKELEFDDASALLTASASTEPAWVLKDATMSVFTGALHQVLTDGLTDAGEFLTLGTIADQVKRRISAHKGDPQRIFKGGAEGLALVRNSAHGSSVADRHLLQERLRLIHGMAQGYLSMMPWWRGLRTVVKAASQAYNALVHTNIFRGSLADDIATFKDIADALDHTLRVVLRGGFEGDLGAIAATVDNLAGIQLAINAHIGKTKKVNVFQPKVQTAANDLLISYCNQCIRLLGSVEELEDETLKSLATAVPPNLRTWHGATPTEAQVLPAVIRLLRRYGFEIDDYPLP